MPAPGPTLLNALTGYGLPGIIIAVLLLLYWLKDRELTAERTARIADAKQFTSMALDLQGKVIEATNKLSDIFEALQKRRP